LCIDSIDQTQEKIQYEQDTIRSYEHFQATGLFVTIVSGVNYPGRVTTITLAGFS